MKKLKQLITNYFGFTPKETRGFFILLLLICLVLIVPLLTDFYLNSISESNNKDGQKLDSLIALLENETSSPVQDSSPKEENQLFIFDPNKIGREDLIRLGLTSRNAETVINYRQKGGVFHIKSDFSNIYGLKPELYEKLYPFIDLPVEKSIAAKVSFERKIYPSNPSFIKKTIPLFDINKADSTQLIALKGIGEKLAKRIVAFRDKLGGFVSKDQFKEIYGLDTAVMKALEEKSFIETNFQPSKLNINTSSVDELKLHPYLRFKLASVIVSYRNQHGKFKSLDELKNIKVISDQEFDKLLPYLEL